MNKLIISLLIITASVSGYALFRSVHTTKIAFVRSGDLVYGYEGMKEAHKSYEMKSMQWQANIDTLKNDLQRAVSRYNLEYEKLSKEEKAQREKLLRQQEGNLGIYSKNIEKQASEEDTKMTEGILNQVNSFVEEYAKEHDYDVVLGTTQSGNVLYGNKYMDITDELLKALNEHYSSSGPTTEASDLTGK